MIDSGDVKAGSRWMLEAANPFGIYETMRNPSARNVAQSLFYPLILAGGALWVSSLSTMPGQGLNLIRYSALRADTYRQAGQGLRLAGPHVLRNAPAALVGGAVIGSTVRGIESGKIEETLPGMIVNPLVTLYFESSKKDTGYELFEFKR